MQGPRSVAGLGGEGLGAGGSTGAPRRFAFAPMSGGIRVLTAVLLALPALLVVLGLGVPGLRPVAVLVALLFAAIFLVARPRVFEVAPAGLLVRAPLRAFAVPAHGIASVRTIDPAGFREEFGLAVRVGAGGLFGGFGWLWTRRRGFVEFYVSRADGGVLIERRRQIPLLVTPERPDDFVAALRAVVR